MSREHSRGDDIARFRNAHSGVVTLCWSTEQLEEGNDDRLLEESFGTVVRGLDSAVATAINPPLFLSIFSNFRNLLPDRGVSGVPGAGNGESAAPRSCRINFRSIWSGARNCRVPPWADLVVGPDAFWLPACLPAWALLPVCCHKPISFFGHTVKDRPLHAARGNLGRVVGGVGESVTMPS